MNQQTGKVRVLGIGIDPLTTDQLHERITQIIDSGRKALVLNVNVHCMNLAQRHPWLKELLNSAEVVFCDGAGVRLGARLLGYELPERITYADWMWQLAELASTRGHTLYFLGSAPGVAARAADVLRARFPALEIVGAHHGYFAKEGGENDAVIAQINAAHPDILVVGMGMPLQEQWLAQNWDRVDAHVFLTGGACFDYVSGTLRRCPRWMADHSLEWLYRLLQEPRRLFRRYVVGNPTFLLRILLERARMGRRSA
ncbi:MAG: WecB/TagA/CpsF family glycosyltransferase [Chloroflexi bacterium]|nr:WecB/TagA/CpsF family glycosyltransferase [Chloroflexota bacterium]